jgi:hypothetical protein
MTCEEHQREFLKRLNEKNHTEEVKEASTEEEIPYYIKLAKFYGNI